MHFVEILLTVPLPKWKFDNVFSCIEPLHV